MKVLEAVARIDSAAAWNLEMNQAIACYAAWLSAEGTDKIFRNGIPAIAGALNPPGKAIRVDGGWRVTGQVSFGSGCEHAQWLVLPALEMDGDQPLVDSKTGQVARPLDRADATWLELARRPGAPERVGA